MMSGNLTKTQTTMLLMTMTIIMIQLASGLSHKELVDGCKRKSLTCLGFNDPNASGEKDCSNNVDKCEFAFAAISRIDGDTCKVHLAGKGTGGWVGIAFSEDPASIMQADNLVVVCVSDSTPKVRILKIQERPGGSTPIEFDDSALSESVLDGKLEEKDGWMICEFKLKSSPKHGKKTLDLKKREYKIGLAGHPTIGIESGKPNRPKRHTSQSRGSSEKKLATFQSMFKSDGVSVTSTFGPYLVVIGLALVIFQVI